ncbi:SRPBCC family protein [Pannonibacter tanglangensis]|uniref:SRPBCC family protein n=1 Tax=Pannonibacter tanglangensis TaxID=2750084 RepID=A0ABW9ZMF1_9HYPH|nr:SRPBCC family protein [Pannonibacter sp. XCT-34]NBN63915.1 SRPBCC family protein [Pannonibacter sp. XCT-34]
MSFKPSGPKEKRRWFTILNSILFLLATGLMLAFLSGVTGHSASGVFAAYSVLVFVPFVAAVVLCFAFDPSGTASLGKYLLVPIVALTLSMLVAYGFMGEGVVCILMLTPVWLFFALCGAYVTYRLRVKVKEKRTLCASLLILPLMVAAVEEQIPYPNEIKTVTRSAVIHATPEQIWPLLEGIEQVEPHEGAWNLSQDVIGIPRPLGATLVGSGVGATRLARWEDGIHFREIITEWEPGKRIGWAFHFDDLSGWAYTDEHLMPTGPYLQILSGGYSLEALPDGSTLLSLDTSYRAMTRVNSYAALWGEFFLGDLHDNLLGLVRQRAEALARPSS